jgi:peptidoglycan/LPS O-acetylase OafA/YrhL
MISRKQSIYLLFATISYILLFFISIYQISDSAGVIHTKMMVHKIVYLQNGENLSIRLILPMIMNLLLIGGSLFTIFLFNNRPLQAKTAQFLLLIGTALLVSMFFSLERIGKIAEPVNDFKSSYTVGVALLVLPLIFFFLANKSIIADDKIIKNANRIR